MSLIRRFHCIHLSFLHTSTISTQSTNTRARSEDQRRARLFTKDTYCLVYSSFILGCHHGRLAIQGNVCLQRQDDYSTGLRLADKTISQRLQPIPSWLLFSVRIAVFVTAQCTTYSFSELQSQQYSQKLLQY